MREMFENLKSEIGGTSMLNAIALFMEGSSSGAGGTIMMVVMLVLMVAVFYFVGIRPQKKQEKQNNEMRNALTVGDEVTTIGGIIGKVVSIKDETCVIATSHDNTKIRILKSAISRVDVKAEDAAD
jgi:preprotein translocase, yajC subunit